MNILYLGPKRETIINFLTFKGDHVINTQEPIGLEQVLLNNIDFIISYGYRYLIKEEIINKFPKKIINLHISLLPWNRGADPNLWSFLEDTPKGVTIHYVNKELDKGDIIVQKEVPYSYADTLRTSYERLSKSIEQLFISNWKKIRDGQIEPYPQPKGGTYHKLKDRKKIEYLLTKGWDTPVIDLIGKGKIINSHDEV